MLLLLVSKLGDCTDEFSDPDSYFWFLLLGGLPPLLGLRLSLIHI